MATSRLRTEFGLYPNLKKIKLMKYSHWNIKDIDQKSLTFVQEEFNIPITIAKIMLLKKIINKKESKSFFYPKISSLINPFSLIDMDKAVDRMILAIDNKEHIMVMGDYDVDGISSVSLFMLYCKHMNISSSFYIPNRSSEGYGLSRKAIDHAKSLGAKLIVTSDCGITAIDEISYSNDQGIDVVVTDHHQQGEKLPEARAIINPNRKDCPYPFKSLCGAGVIFKLLCGLTLKLDKDLAFVYSLIDIVAIATVADYVNILGENRIIVSEGLKRISSGSNIGLTALFKSCGISYEKANQETLSFGIIPKLNAAGRMGDAARAVKLITTSNPFLATEISSELLKENDKRRLLTKKIEIEAISHVRSNNLNEKEIIVLSSSNWHDGIIGIVAARIKDEYNKPTIVISVDEEGIGKASCRSIVGIDIVEALSSCKELLINFGGHPMAAGFTIEERRVDAFYEKIEDFLMLQKRKSSDSFSIDIDCELSLKDITNPRFIPFLYSLEPYGPGNEKPVFISKGLKVDGLPQILGKERNVIKYNVNQNKYEFVVIGFNMVDYYNDLASGNSIDLVYSISKNYFRGKETIQLEMKDMRVLNDS